jgi:tripartite-type tricarboxylate transporter receptor subunit TctC
MATGGLGTSSHLVAELFAMSAGIRLLIVPYKGGGPALTDLIGGHVDTRIDQISSSVPHIKSGKVRAIATTTVQRVALLPGVPTLAESGMPGFEASVVTGLLAPAGTPPEIVRRLNAALVKVLSDPVVVERFASLAAVVRPSTSEELAKFIREDLARWRKVVRETGIKIE